ncbi:MAG: PhnD/SsuA/transferrin family substrate-binding protein [Pseudomonadota bacterium]
MYSAILHRLGVAFVSLSLVFPVIVQSAEKYRLGVAPVMDYERTIKTYQPLADYLSQEAGIEIELVPARNFISYWSSMRKPGHYDFVFDGAHLAAYRVNKMDHKLLAKVSGVLSFTLISRSDDLVLDPEELINRKVAVQASPNLGGVLVFNLFNNPARLPQLVEVKTAIDALDAVRSKRADAAYVPTQIVSNYPDAAVIVTSDPLPNMTMTASPRVPDEVVQAVRKSLYEAKRSEKAAAVLAAMSIEGFDQAKRSDYTGLERLLEGMWDY